MKLRILSVFAAAALLAACETAPDSSATSAGEGVSTTNQPSSTSSTLSESSPEWFAVNVGDRVFFGFDKYDLSGEARRTLELQSAWLKKYPQYKVVVEGHADERGTREYNLALGERRANSVKDYLVALGIDPSRVETISYGKERPVALGHDEESWAKNRRSVSVIR
ncbi:peptidoglycan-associated lipoprotein [Thalassospira sp. MBR-102]|jgi:peptidoglycan-associated lipoprotein|uniref:Peptidoglycan-associated lipoprotein n=3 Tax=Thalassospira TaxID=168934 RepID=A0ABR5Y8S5_9PROT|nr:MULTISPECIES: peptidoglycan-associated lipoprotein Pal [Thalassospira]MBR9779757.1 peptidoglycan-associated lipoprotein Pal [Rhodospirillales bacterium]AJD51553.1 outer membrane lipoprotein omp16 [Thalassospira xiamenensis M-5 = DSM 17429]KEO58716.1 OmpA/MotB [Thalassospira permensis NBRC 106175]KZD03377.1 cell envelope biogenesis protein OmpA [Thalassospira xiamenensis]KZD06800.1 cell envelope biogenesis protein OmpA [Thalassospira xiamenensis]|tara:strand:+ start:1792 stop:2289 length:498 start_codon:yes stop_codon:yes gene_type:complete|eukprot:TRINITY_DN88_c0_g1_i1.p3 TRINITY_DN88_c0_g1~~TRINITY_DN88_c0_g1_i1.p3  ORF type:complete len:166 (-),score=34.50 TRINITY_DN88_c0_g1_i1:329-826(-)